MMNKEKEINNFCKKYILFNALNGDLIVLAIIDTLFFSIVKNLDASHITLLSTIPAALGIVVQPYILKIIHKLGNTKSVRISSICLLISCMILTFGTEFWILILGKLFYEITFVFQNMNSVMLKNNLKYINRDEDYIHVRNKANIAYSVSTAIIALLGGYLFSINAYLPMYINILICFVGVILTLYMKDYSDFDTISEEKINTSKLEKMSLIVYISMISYAIFYTVINIGQSNGKLFIQYQLNEYFDTETTSMYLGMIVLISRIARIISNLSFDKIYRKFKDRINILLCTILVFSILFIIIGNFINSNVYLKFGIMSSGFFGILAIRDSFKIYIQDLILRVSKPEEQQALLANLELAKKIGTTLTGFVVSAALVKFSLIWIIIGASILAVMTLKTTIRLFEVVKRSGKLVHE